MGHRGHRGWILAGIVVGFASWLAIGATGFWLLRTTWAAYALAEPHKAYSLAMLFSRLTVGVVCTVSAGWVATIVAKGSTKAAWWLGGVLLLISTPVHLFEVWAEYPPWYHFAYLLPLMPLTALGGYMIRGSRRPSLGRAL